MKRFITVSALVIATGAAFANDGPFGNPDLHGLQYSSALSESSGAAEAKGSISLDAMSRGNPDLYSGTVEGDAPVAGDPGPAVTSLDAFTRGNPDFDLGEGPWGIRDSHGSGWTASTH